MARPDFGSVDEYIAAQPPPVRPMLERVRATIRKALPGAAEGISYQIPIYKLGGVMVLYFAAFQRHYSIYPATERVLAALGEELAGRVHSKATIRFPLEDAVPTRLIARVAKLRAAEVSESAAAPGTKRAPSQKRAATKKANPAARRKVAKRG